MAIEHDKIAIWAITPNGVRLARQLCRRLPQAEAMLSQKWSVGDSQARCFDRLVPAVGAAFDKYGGHLFIMATGIAVRSIAPCLNHKTIDPAVVVMDDRGCFTVSLLSGHIGGANRLTRLVAGIVGAVPVITTATDVHDKPAIDLLALERGLRIENPAAIKAINMALLTNQAIRMHDPYGLIADALPAENSIAFKSRREDHRAAGSPSTGDAPGLWVDDTVAELPPEVLVLRPDSLVAGIGCNRDTPQDEIRSLLIEVLRRNHLALGSLGTIASIDIKAAEPGLCGLGRELQAGLVFFNTEQLSRIDKVPNPSAMVRQHVGVSSVCEAAAILASANGRLIVPKQRSRNATVAIARRSCLSSESDPAD